MRYSFFAFGLLVLTCRVSTAEEPKLTPGLYFIFEGDADPALPRLDRADVSGTVAIGKKLSDRLNQPSLVSESNDNSRYRLTASCPLKKDTELNQQFAFVVA